MRNNPVDILNGKLFEETTNWDDMYNDFLRLGEYFESIQEEIVSRNDVRLVRVKELFEGLEHIENIAAFVHILGLQTSKNFDWPRKLIVANPDIGNKFLMTIRGEIGTEHDIKIANEWLVFKEDGFFGPYVKFRKVYKIGDVFDRSKFA